MDNFKYIKNVSEGVGTILVYRRIGDLIDKKGNITKGINGADFANEMAYLQENCSHINIRYNSEGGSVLDGYAIYSSVINSKVPTTSYIDGLAASTAGWCALASNKVELADYGSLMIHGASGEPQELVDMANGSISTMISNRTGLTLDYVNELMKTETLYNAFDKTDREFLVKNKIVDNIFTTNKVVKIKKTESLYNMAIIYNQLIEKNMDNNQDNVQAIDELKAALASAEAVNNELKSKIEQFENEKTAREEAEKTVLKNKAELLVNNAVKEGKLKSDESAKTLELASKDEANFEFVSNMIAKVGTGKEAVKVFNSANVKNSNDERTNWTYNDWEKKDSEGLVNMYVNNRAEYELLLTTYKIK